MSFMTHDVVGTWAEQVFSVYHEVDLHLGGSLKGAFGVQGLVLRLGFRVQGSGFRVQGSGFRVQGSGFRG